MYCGCANSQSEVTTLAVLRQMNRGRSRTSGSPEDLCVANSRSSGSGQLIQVAAMTAPSIVTPICDGRSRIPGYRFGRDAR
jgi:hypothetical protein